MNKKRKEGEKNQFTGGKKLIQHATADKSNSASKYCPYSFTADAFIYYCLPLPIASAEVHQGSHLISAVEPPERNCHVTDDAPCWLFVWCACQLQSWDPSWCCNISVTLSVFCTWFTLSTASLLSTRMWHMWESSLFFTVVSDSSLDCA